MTRSSRPLLSPLHTFSPLRHSSPRLATLLLLVVVSLHSSLLRAPLSALALSQDAIGSIIADSISFDGIGPGEDFGDYEERYGVSDEDDYTADAEGDGAGMGMEGVSMEWDEEQPEAAIHGVLDVGDVTLPKLADGRQKLLLLFYAPWDRFSKVRCGARGRRVVQLGRGGGGGNRLEPLLNVPRSFLPSVSPSDHPLTVWLWLCHVVRVCGAHQEMVVIYKDVATSLATHTDVLLAKVDGDRYWKLSSRYDAASYPHLVYFDQENKMGISYEGERTADAIVSYVLHGERRGPRLAALQAVVQAFRAGSSGEQREAAIAKAEALVAGMSAADKDVGLLYIKAMKAAVAFGEDFLQKEARRLESSLEGGGLPPSTYTKFRQQIDIAKELDPTAAHE
ncbi:unnamed protein product [Closterium sp. Naga37s-1]|nr:unnamed protein product [Closterium sp. Naga37s-1]